jgi:hypothetical protein
VIQDEIKKTHRNVVSKTRFAYKKKIRPTKSPRELPQSDQTQFPDHRSHVTMRTAARNSPSRRNAAAVSEARSTKYHTYLSSAALLANDFIPEILWRKVHHIAAITLHTTINIYEINIAIPSKD